MEYPPKYDTICLSARVYRPFYIQQTIISSDEKAPHKIVQFEIICCNLFPFGITLLFLLSTSFCGSRYKCLLVYVQAEIHCKWKSVKTWQFLRRLLRQPPLQECSRLGKLYLIWSTYTPQSPRQDAQFPHQGMSTGLAFHKGS